MTPLLRTGSYPHRVTGSCLWRRGWWVSVWLRKQTQPWQYLRAFGTLLTMFCFVLLCSQAFRISCRNSLRGRGSPITLQLPRAAQGLSWPGTTHNPSSVWSSFQNWAYLPQREQCSPGQLQAAVKNDCRLAITATTIIPMTYQTPRSICASCHLVARTAWRSRYNYFLHLLNRLRQRPTFPVTQLVFGRT